MTFNEVQWGELEDLNYQKLQKLSDNDELNYALSKRNAKGILAYYSWAESVDATNKFFFGNNINEYVYGDLRLTSSPQFLSSLDRIQYNGGTNYGSVNNFIAAFDGTLNVNLEPNRIITFNFFATGLHNGVGGSDDRAPGGTPMLFLYMDSKRLSQCTWMGLNMKDPHSTRNTGSVSISWTLVDIPAGPHSFALRGFCQGGTSIDFQGPQTSMREGADVQVWIEDVGSTRAYV